MFRKIKKPRPPAQPRTRRSLHGEQLESRHLLTGGLRAVSVEATSLDVVLNLGPVISRNLDAVSALQRAAEFWESVIDDPVQVFLDVEFDDTRSGGDSALAATDSAFTTYFYPDIRQRLIEDAAANETIVSRLPTPEALEFQLATGFQIRDPLVDAPVIRLTTANAKALGFHAVNVPESEFEANRVADASIFFSTDTNYDFNTSNGVSRNAFDFEGVAVHEIGHALGVVSAVDVVDSLLGNGATGVVDPTVPDLFRLAPGQGNEFSTAPRLLTTGGNDTLQVFHDGAFDVSPFNAVIPQLETGDIPLSSGTEVGDGQQASHFKDDARSGEFLGILDPTINQGSSAVVTDVDLRVLGLIGWDIGSVFSAPDAVASVAPAGQTNGRELTGNVSESDARVFIRLPDLHGENTVSVSASLSAGVATFEVTNAGSSEADISSIQFVLPGVGGGSGATAATPFFDPTTDFSATASDVNRVSLVSPESDNIAGDDIAEFSKSLQLLFSDFEPGESFDCLLYTSPSPRDATLSRMPSSA